MLLNIFRVAFRSLRRNRGFALLNVVGLSIGMACVILIALFVQDEWKTDGFHQKGDRIVWMTMDFVSDEGLDESGSTQGDLAPALVGTLPSVEAAVRFVTADPVLSTDTEAFETDQILYADPEVFDVFTFPLRAGDPSTALATPGQIVLTETLARTLFGDTSPVGEQVMQAGEPLTVSAVMADVPEASHLQFDALVSLSTAEDPGWFYGNWFSTVFATYALLQEGVSPEAFEAELPAFTETVAGDAMRAADSRIAFHSIPLSEVYLNTPEGYAGFLREMGPVGSAVTLRILILVALFVLLVAIVNFTNLATARSLDRAREVGVRKTMGAQSGGLVAQFMTEAVVLSLVATGLAVVLAVLVLPTFQDIASKSLTLSDLGTGWVGVLGLAVLTGVLAGVYPALVLSKFRPADVLKGTFSTGREGQGVRSALVVVQFGISVALIAATAIVFSQLRHMQSQDLGLDVGGNGTEMVVLPFSGDAAVQDRLPAVQNRLRTVPGVTHVSASVSAPTGASVDAGGTIEGPDGTMAQLDVEMAIADSSYAQVYGLTMLAGRTPVDGRPTDALREYVFNETAIRAVGYADPQAAIGKRAVYWGIEGEIVGVVADYHLKGLQTAIEPLALTAPDGLEGFLSVFSLRVETAGLSTTLAALETVWADAVPSRPFKYSFLDEDFAAQYATEQRFGRFFALLSGLAIAIACLGLFGLAAHAAASRTKEIGVRRVLGATVAQVVVLLTRNVVALVAIGVALAGPVVWLGMSRWLDTFAYRVSLGWEPLALAAGVVLAIAVLTVGGHAVRAALADPVQALRSE
ncbi:MAG: ABC transporter permease [Rubricoccaceae bacterium]